ncbi:hypothetical protein ABKV64_04450 [Enterobacter roggenkampii]|uniref:hypothetical protein n=1 Tax=Enterobacter roggenkampii TaxID=1812935 RepID=UPI002288A9E3|nr:hypothetical protein [Enterobacter roggenkampii]HCT5200952.1 hypothetical protein [Enterobacter roggenkampii]
MSNKYEDLIKNARMNADCGEHMSPAEVTTLLNVVETTFAALAGEVYDLKHPGTYLPSKRETPATDAFLAEVRAQGVDALVERRLTAARLAKEAGHEITARDLEGEAIRARFFAMEIRKGVHS